MKSTNTGVVAREMHIQAVSPLLPAGDFVNGPLLWVLRNLCCGGIERQFFVTAQALHAEGVTDISLLSESLDPETGNDFFLDDVKPFLRSIHLIAELPEVLITKLVPKILPVLPEFPWLSEQRQSELFLYILWMLHLRPRLVHVWHGDFPLTALAACITGVPRVILCGQSLSPRRKTPLGLEGPNEEETFLFYKTLCAYPACIMTNNSNAGRRDYAEWLGIDPAQIYLTPNIVDIAPAEDSEAAVLKESLGIAADTQVIGGMCRVVNIKDPVLWMQSVAEVVKNKNNVTAVLWGEGPLWEGCKETVKRMGLEDKILLPGKTDNSALALTVCDVFLLTSFVEGMPNAVLEAQALGIPVVTTNAGGVGDAVINGHTGWVVGKRTPAALAERLLWVLENKDWSIKAGEYAKKHMLKNFSVKRNLQFLKKIYHDAI